MGSLGDCYDEATYDPLPDEINDAEEVASSDDGFGAQKHIKGFIWRYGGCGRLSRGHKRLNIVCTHHI